MFSRTSRTLPSRMRDVHRRPRPRRARASAVEIVRVRALTAIAAHLVGTGAHVERRVDALDVRVVHAELAQAASVSEAGFGDSIGPKQP